MTPDFSIFPTKEEWGTGDEAMDGKLSIALKKVVADLSIETISEFYFFGLSLKPRAYNPGFHTTIELVTKASLFTLYPNDPVDVWMKKIKGRYFLKSLESFNLKEKDTILSELIRNKMFRYGGQVDFYLYAQSIEEKNPFVRYSLKKSPLDLHVKILMKDFRAYLNGEKESTLFNDSLFQALRLGEKVLFIDNFAEIWYDEDQIFSLPLMKL